MLTERRKADRVQMTAQVHALALSLGVAAEIEVAPFGDMCPQMILVRLRHPRGLELAWRR